LVDLNDYPYSSVNRGVVKFSNSTHILVDSAFDVPVGVNQPISIIFNPGMDNNFTLPLGGLICNEPLYPPTADFAKFVPFGMDSQLSWKPFPYSNRVVSSIYVVNSKGPFILAGNNQLGGCN